MSSWGFAWRTMVRDPIRAMLAVAGVAIIGALLFDMLMLSRGLLLSFGDLLEASGHDVRVISGESVVTERAPIAGATALSRAISRLPEVENVVFVRFEPAVLVTKGHPSRTVDFIGSSDGAQRGAWRIVKGAAASLTMTPGDPYPLVISTKLAAALQIGPGAIARIRPAHASDRSAAPPVAFRIVGVGEFLFEAASDLTVSTTTKGFAAVHGESTGDEADIILVTSRRDAGADAAVAAISRLRPDLHVQSNEQVLAQFHQNGFAYFQQISSVLSLMTLAFAFLLVATLLTMSVNQRLGEVATLRALGFPRRRIAANLLCESALLVGVGGGVALPLGGLLATWLDRILRTMPGVPERIHFFVLEPRAIVLHASLMGATAVLAALYPMWLAARLPIAATLRREIVS